MTAAERQRLRIAIDAARRQLVASRECLGCDTKVVATRNGRRYCSRECANRHWHVRHKERVAA